MNLKLYQGLTLTDATTAMLQAIDNSLISTMHVIIVPDRFSLQCEKLVLKLLPQKALFNVRVMTLTRFSVELLNKLGVQIKNGDVLSSGETLLLTAKAIDNVSKEFKTLKKGGIDFCYEVSKLISQFKSSGVAPAELNLGAVGMTGNKYHDLALIYEEYERLLDGRLDANGRLALLNDKLKESNLLADTKIYFAQFDAFTKAGYDIIKTFTQCAEEVNISFTESKSIGNDYIYEKDIFQKVSKLASELGLLVQVERKNVPLSPQKEAIIQGLYSYEKVKCDNKGFFNYYTALSSSEEVESVVKLIRYLTFKGKKYRDIQIAVGSLDKKQSQIENIFSQYHIPYYIDSSITADKTILGNLIRSYFETVVMGYNHDKLVDLLSNPLVCEDCGLVERSLHLAIEGKGKYKKYIEKDFANSDILEKIEKSKNADEFGAVVEQILSRAESKHTEMLYALEKRGDLKEKNINIQIDEIIKETTDLIARERKEEISASEYFKLLSLLLSFRQVSTVPTYIDGVFVGDATESCFGQSDTLIVMGAENLPIVSNDNGLLSDDDLNQNFKNPIEPTIRMLNRRKRFRLFSLLTQAERRLVVFSQRVDEEGKKKEAPTYLKNLCDIFGQHELKAGSVFFANRSEDLQLKLLSAPLKRKKKFLEEENVFVQNRNSLGSLADLVFAGGRARVTQLEQYFSCPFKHFAVYGLKLKEFEIQKFEPRDIGNICHKGAELLLEDIMKKGNLDNQSSESLKAFVETNFDKIIKAERLEEKMAELVEREALEKFIKNQMLDLFEDIVKELRYSKFKPYKLEYQFEDCYGGHVSLIGKADRVDVFDDYARVVDYKTGMTGNLLKELKFGQKLQLFLYQSFTNKKLNKDFGGVFYFNARFDYSKDDKEKTLLKGLMPNDDKIIEAYDYSLEATGKSDIVSVRKGGEKDPSYKGSAISKVKMKTLTDYAERMTENAIEEIDSGYIKPKPHEDSCRSCKYFAVCGHDNNKKRKI